MELAATAKTPNGRQVTYVIPFSNYMEAVCRAVFDGREYPYLPFLQPRIIVDVGANVGCSALLFSNSYPGASVYALEPSGEAFGFLQRNVAHLSQVQVFKIGAYDRDATTVLHLGSHASVTNSLVANSMTGGRSETIVLRRFSNFLAEHKIDRISLLKIDTEGAEIPILNDIAHMFDRLDAVMIEIHSEADRITIDRMFNDRFTLFSTQATFPHRIAVCYVAKQILTNRTDYDRIAMSRPAL